MRVIMIALALLVLGSKIVTAGNIISWEDAANYYGKYKAVEGKIVTIKCISSTCFLNFDQNYRETFSAVIYSSDLKNFPENLEHYYLDKKIQVRGVIKEYQDSPQIILNDQSQITLMDNVEPLNIEDNPEQIVCFKKDELQGGSDMWVGSLNDKCVKRKDIHCYLDSSVLVPPYVCWDIRDGSLLSFED